MLFIDFFFLRDFVAKNNEKPDNSELFKLLLLRTKRHLQKIT